MALTNPPGLTCGGVERVQLSQIVILSDNILTAPDLGKFSQTGRSTGLRPSPRHTEPPEMPGSQ